jgi:NAD-dependent DNA ligase
MYSIGEQPLLDDMEYNRIHKIFTEEGTIPDYTSRSWSSDPCPVELLKKFNMAQFIKEISLQDKTDSIESLVKEEDVRSYYGKTVDKYVLSFKIDGWNIQATYYNGELLRVQTRGRKNDALVVDQVSRLIPNKIPITQETRIVFELCISNSSFLELRQILKDRDVRSQRASVRTCLANQSLLNLLTPLAFDVQSERDKYTAEETYTLLENWGFKTPEHRIIEGDSSSIMHTIQELANRKDTYNYPSDGVVVRRNTARDLMAVRVSVWGERDYMSYITGVEEEHSSSNLGCKLLIYPIRTEQSVQRRVNITNIKRIMEYGLYPGSPIVFSLRSDAIADINIEKTRRMQEAYAFNPEDVINIVQSRELLKEQRRNI